MIYSLVGETDATENVWRPEDNLEDLILSFQHVDLRIKLSSPGLWASAFPAKPFLQS